MIYVEEHKIQIESEANIFVTMNPGYTGRVELPVNLKNLFRPIQMVLPEWSLISEILLVRAGFNSAYEISQRLTHV